MNETIPAAVPVVRILGSDVHLLGLDDVLARFEHWIQNPGPRCRRVIVTGFHGLWEAHRDADLRHVFNTADLWIPDGIAPVLVARLRGFRGVERIPGAQLMEGFFQRADQRGFRSFFFGDTEETLSAMKIAVERKYPGHVVAGTLSPPFGEPTAEQDEEHLRIIHQSRPDVLWVGLGLPKQERWIYQRIDRLHVPVAVGVGAAFRFLSGHVRRAPAWMGSMGLEWAYRLYREPKKCWRRSLVQGPQFLACVALELLGLAKHRDEPAAVRDEQMRG